MNIDLVSQIKHLSVGSDFGRYPPLADGAIVAVETGLGFPIPDLLRQCYNQIANGGYGPQGRIMGLKGGRRSDYGDAIDSYRMLEREYVDVRGIRWPSRLLPFCGWGDAIVSCVMCDKSNQIVTLEGGKLWQEQYSLQGFFLGWLDGQDLLAHGTRVRFEDIRIGNPFTRTEQTVRARKRHG